MDKSDKILEVLKDIKEKDPKVAAVLVAKVGLEGLVMFPETFKQDAAAIWEPLSKNLNELLLIVRDYGGVGLRHLYTDILGFEVYFKVIHMSDTALMVIRKVETPMQGAEDVIKVMDEQVKNICDIMEASL